ncbi:MAG TPA: hypothetical protein VM871_11085 [Flavisolibacter sp.]|nr:hypothetical protein [Flavisolibacter sp.]
MRLMSLYIEFDNQTHLALVSVREKEREFVCQVRYVVNSLHYELPENLLVFDLNGVLKQPGYVMGGGVKSLMSSTVKAISQHLQAG